ncbi:bifunctional phosphopantothenoylcysteine decarboxylase/phosphopantothenate--cysteine ligase CoaBC [bacterium]|nr:bifunctional phosphopantothenoylcysteine decarboxylase/phosphopantothenate--cysteine ligase CoaBC [bacterium]
MLSGKNILLGICGGIAAYKICFLIRKFKQNGANVQVVATPNALNFVTKLTLQTLSQNEVKVDEFEKIKNFSPEHISFADSSDIFVIAPATANTISKIANGICDNLLTSVACAFTKPMIFAPAMNTNMWKNSAVQKNIQTLKNKGFRFCDPESGFLACGYNGQGRLCDVEKIFNKVVETLKNGSKLKGKKIVVTAGGTREKIDSVRFLSNYSSGKMGIAIADTAYNQGAEVVLISTVKTSKPYKVVNVDSALEMKDAVEKEFSDSNCLIMAAAVADYRAKEIAEQKIKKTDEDEITLTFVKNPDILKEICTKKGLEQIVIGFCAESQNLIENAKEKILAKGCNFLVANDISRKDTGFSSDYNEVLILDKNGNINKLEKTLKTEIAKEILKVLYCD